MCAKKKNTSKASPVRLRKGEITQKDLARLAGVSLTTIYNALHDKELVKPKTREKIQQIMDEYDYRPNAIARAMVRGKTDVIGIVVPRLEVPYYARLVGEIESSINVAGYNCIACQHLDDILKEDREIRMLREHRVDGMIIRTSGRRECPGIFERLVKAQVPFVMVDRKIEGLENYFVGSDNSKDTETLTEYLISKGHKRIAITIWQESLEHLGDKYDAYCKALQKHGIEVDEDLIIHCGKEYFSGYEETYDMLNRTAHNKPTAILASDDTAVIGVMQALMKRGIRIPQDIAVASIGGYMEGMMAPLLPFRLTCLLQPLTIIGREVVRLLNAQINGQNFSTGPILCPGEIRVGDTV